MLNEYHDEISLRMQKYHWGPQSVTYGASGTKVTVGRCYAGEAICLHHCLLQNIVS